MDNNELSTNLAEVGTDCISRQSVVDALERAKQNIHHNIERAIGDAVCEILDAVEDGIKQLPPIQPVSSSETPNSSDTISRQQAIGAVQNRHMMLSKEKVLLINDLEKLPSVQPEIIRCKDCLMHGVCRFEQGLGLDGYCSQAERRTDE